MTSIQIKKGFDLNIIGQPAADVTVLPQPDRVALLPERIPFIKPRLKVKIGDTVQLGTPLIEDRRDPAIQFHSPGGGRITDIRFGPRRVIEAIVVAVENDEKFVPFESYTTQDVEKLERSQLVQAIVKGGLWPLIRELPFRDYPRPDSIPPALYVCLDNLEPFQPRPEIYLKGNQDLLDFGLTVMQRLAEGRLVVSAQQNFNDLARRLNGATQLRYSGLYPAHDPGVLLYHTKTSADQNHAWYIDGQDVLLIAALLKHGRYPTDRIVSLGGSAVSRPCHVLTRLGAPLFQIIGGRLQEDELRFISGGVLTGYASQRGSYLGLREKALNLLPEGNMPGELLSLFRPGYRKPTFSRAFASRFNRNALEYDCNIHGGDRACIACGYCTLVCPVDILPQFTLKAILAGEVEEALQHGLLDCVECGLCSYVCPSKIDLFETLKNAKADFYKELGK